MQRFTTESSQSATDAGAAGASAVGPPPWLPNLEDAEGRRARRLLAGGFLAIIILLVLDGLLGIRGIALARQAAREMAEDQQLQMALIEEIQREQMSMNDVFERLAGAGDSDRDSLLQQIEESENNIRQIAALAPEEPTERAVWERWSTASKTFSDQARALLGDRAAPLAHSHQLLRAHHEVLSAVSRLVASSHQRVRHWNERLESLLGAQARQTTLLLGLSLAVSLAGAVVVLRLAAALYGRIGAQARELNEVSWQLLNHRETLARRLSHELHDELGQTLTALKMNLRAHGKAPCADPKWLEDCLGLLRETIRSTHEISQLLHPTILDDFGLDSALSWLCESTAERSGLEIHCLSTLGRRLTPETETHLFRMAQEALTNVLRHSGAGRVDVELREADGEAVLEVRDNGRGLPPATEIRRGSLGLTGMYARARICRGRLDISSQPGGGVTVTARIPLEEANHAQANPSFAL